MALPLVGTVPGTLHLGIPTSIKSGSASLAAGRMAAALAAKIRVSACAVCPPMPHAKRSLQY
jgi:hypothetical protein